MASRWGPGGALVWGIPAGVRWRAITARCPTMPLQSAFADECEQLYAAEQHEKLLDKFISALDVVLSSSCSDQGERRRGRVAAAPACGCGHDARPACPARP